MQYWNKFKQVAYEKLDKKDYLVLVDSLKTVQTKREKRERKEKEYVEFAERNLIKLSSQTLNPALPPLFKDQKKQQLTNFIMEEVNKQLMNSANFSLRTGRTIAIDFNTHDPLKKKGQEIWGDNPAFHSSFTAQLLPEILEKLKKAGYIQHYHIINSLYYFKIVC